MFHTQVVRAAWRTTSKTVTPCDMAVGMRRKCLVALARPDPVVYLWNPTLPLPSCFASTQHAPDLAV